MRKVFFTSMIVITVIVFFSCEKQSDSTTSASSTIGTGGSLAKFTIVGTYLYLADDATISVYRITDLANPTFVKKISVGNSVETIYPYDNKLFIGSQFGMFIYSLADPENPIKLGEALHVRSCDPVVAKDTFAFVTLRGGTPCGGTTNALYSYNVKNVAAPALLNVLPLPKPIGLCYKDTTLFVCCEDSGMAIINIKNPTKPFVRQYIKTNSFYDVIPLNNLLICLVKTGINLYDITDVNNIQLVKSLNN